MGATGAHLTHPAAAPPPIRVLFIDDDPLALTALRSSFGETSGIEIDCLWGSTDEILAGLEERRPQAVLVDLVLSAGDQDGIDLAIAMRARDPGCYPVILTSSTSPDSALRAWKAGIPGYLTKHYLSRNVDRLASLIRNVIDGVIIYEVDPRAVDGIALSDRELEVLRHKAAGHDRSEIGERLYVSPRTVDSHVANARAKLGAASLPEALRIAQERGLLDE
jgi:DNA-binding NarL/FixJ family response regulator